MHHAQDVDTEIERDLAKCPTAMLDELFMRMAKTRFTGGVKTGLPEAKQKACYYHEHDEWAPHCKPDQAVYEGSSSSSSDCSDTESSDGGWDFWPGHEAD